MQGKPGDLPLEPSSEARSRAAERRLDPSATGSAFRGLPCKPNMPALHMHLGGTSSAAYLHYEGGINAVAEQRHHEPVDAQEPQQPAQRAQRARLGAPDKVTCTRPFSLRSLQGTCPCTKCIAPT